MNACCVPFPLGRWVDQTREPEGSAGGEGIDQPTHPGRARYPCSGTADTSCRGCSDVNGMRAAERKRLTCFLR